MDVSQHQPITILGAGAWGTALALYLARRGQIVNIWSVEPSEINAMVQDKANQRYLPGYPLPELIHPTIELGKAVNGIKDIIMVVPSVGFRQTLVSLKPFISADVRIICATKGLDAETGQLLNEVVEDVLGKEQRYAVLSGPSFAREVAAGLPAAVIIASKDKNLQTHLMQRFNSSLFQTHPSEDIIGVEIGGVVKKCDRNCHGYFRWHAIRRECKKRYHHQWLSRNDTLRARFRRPSGNLCRPRRIRRPHTHLLR